MTRHIAGTVVDDGDTAERVGAIKDTETGLVYPFASISAVSRIAESWEDGYGGNYPAPLNPAEMYFMPSSKPETFEARE